MKKEKEVKSKIKGTFWYCCFDSVVENLFFHLNCLGERREDIVQYFPEFSLRNYNRAIKTKRWKELLAIRRSGNGINLQCTYPKCSHKAKKQ